MRTIHLLRKLDPSEWGGTETALQRLFQGLRQQDVRAVAYCPRLPHNGDSPPDPLTRAGCEVRRFNAFVPIAGISARRRRQMIAVGGNIMSFDLVSSLWREREVSLIHTHALGRLGGIARTVARHRQLPFVVSIHGGVLDLPDSLRRAFRDRVGGLEYGKVFGWLFRSHCVLRDADLIITCNHNEARLLQQQFPEKRVVVLPHGIPIEPYRIDSRAVARKAFPSMAGREVLLCLGRIDPVKNQSWLIEQFPAVLARHPRALLVLAGPCTDELYGERITRRIQELDLGSRVLLTGALPPEDPRLVGLLQLARAVLVPSVSETFGLVVLEAWAAGSPVLSSRTSGPSALIRSGHNGWLFDLAHPELFHTALDQVLANPADAARMAERGLRVACDHSIPAVALKLKNLYEELREAKRCDT